MEDENEKKQDEQEEFEENEDVESEVSIKEALFGYY
jgi:hypothetical protein